MKNNKRIVSIALVIVLLFSGVAYASSINGLFEGFSIVNIFIDGKKIQGDVPAINFHGRTMVPVRFVSEELGANVQWDGNTASVYIDKNTNTGGNYTEEDIDMIKLYGEIAHQYKQLEELGEALRDIDGRLGIFIHIGAFIEGYKDYILFDLAVDTFKDTIYTNNQLITSTEIIVEKANLKGIDVTNMYSILYDYTSAIDVYKTSFDSAYLFIETNQKNYLKDLAASTVMTALKVRPKVEESVKGYNYYNEMILNY